MIAHPRHDFRMDTFDTIDGKHMLWLSSDPDRKFEVVALLDARGDDVDDPEEAAGGIVKLGEESFTTFMFQ